MKDRRSDRPEIWQREATGSARSAQAPDRAEQEGRAGQSKATAEQSDQQDQEADTEPGEGVSDLEAGGTNRARDSRLTDAVAKIASPTG